MPGACPVVGVHHLEGHLSAVYLEPKPPPLPHLALVVSGGHTSLIVVRDRGSFRELGATRDDAAGEAFDKVAKLLGLGYPGGVAIDREAKAGDPWAIAFPRPMLKAETGYEFSYSGLKTAALGHVRRYGAPSGRDLADFCASFQHAVVELLVRKTRQAGSRPQSGARAALRRRCRQLAGCARRCARRARKTDLRFNVASPRRCTDNAAMIAAAGCDRLARGETTSPEALRASSSLPLPSRS